MKHITTTTTLFSLLQLFTICIGNQSLALKKGGWNRSVEKQWDVPGDQLLLSARNLIDKMTKNGQNWQTDRQ